MRVLSRRAGIGKAAIAVIVVIIIIGGAAGAYYLSATSKTTASSSSTISSVTTAPSLSSSSTAQTTSGPTSGSAVSSASASSSSPSSSAVSPQTLVMDDANYPINGVNVLTFGSEVPWPDWFEYSVYQPLIVANVTAEYQKGVVQYLPVLATNYTVTDQNTTYTFNLRQNVNFSNGDAFNAYQLWGELYTIYYLSGNSSGWWQSYPVFNMTSVNFGPSTLAFMTQSGLLHPSAQLTSVMSNKAWPIYVTGPYQIVFHLNAPFLYFLGTLVSYVGMTFDTQYVLSHGGVGTPAAVNSNFETTPIPGTGPYMITKMQPNAYIEFSKNPNYWGTSLSAQQVAGNPVVDPGHVKNVVVNYVSDDLSRYAALSSGQVQIAAISSPAEWPLVLANPSKYAYTVLPPWSADAVALPLNTNEYPTNITAVRQAIVHAINYSDINSTVFYGTMTAGMGPEYPLYKQFYDLGNYAPYQYNVTQAEAILKAAGINASSLPPIVFRTIADCAYCNDIAQIVQADLAQIGLTVQIVILASTQYYAPYGSYSTNRQNAQQIGQISILGGESWAPSALTPADNWVSLVSNNSSWGNWAGYSNPQVQACVNAFTNTANQTSIQSTCKAAQAAIYDDAPYAWIGFAKLWYYSGSLVWQKGVIKSFALDPNFNGIDTMPLINTVTFG